jgi:hypothetical protein
VRLLLRLFVHVTVLALVRPLCGKEFSTADDSFGSTSACQARDLTAGKLTFRLIDREPDVRSGQWTTHC